LTAQELSLFASGCYDIVIKSKRAVELFRISNVRTVAKAWVWRAFKQTAGEHAVWACVFTADSTIVVSISLGAVLRARTIGWQCTALRTKASASWDLPNCAVNIFAVFADKAFVAVATVFVVAWLARTMAGARCCVARFSALKQSTKECAIRARVLLSRPKVVVSEAIVA